MNQFGIGRIAPHWTWWGVLLGLMTGIGLVRVALATMVWQSAYAAGHQVRQLHTLENDTQWLYTQVVALQAPAHLVKAMAKERPPFVARVELPATLARTRLAKANQ